MRPLDRSRRGLVLVVVVILLVIVVTVVTAFGTFVFDEHRGAVQSLKNAQTDASLMAGVEHTVRIIDYYTAATATSAAGRPVASAVFDETMARTCYPPPGAIDRYRINRLPALFLLNNDPVSEWASALDSPTSDDFAYPGERAWELGPTAYFRPSEYDAEKDYVLLLDHSVAPYNPFGLPADEFNSSPSAYCGRWIYLSLGDQNDGTAAYVSIEDRLTADFQSEFGGSATYTPYADDRTESGGVRGRYAVLAMEIDGALHPLINQWNGSDPSDPLWVANPFFDDFALMSEHFDVFERIMGPDAIAVAADNGVNYPTEEFNANAIERLTKLIVLNETEDVGAVNGYTDFFRAVYPATMNLVNKESRYLHQKYSMQSLMRPYPTQRELASGVRPRLNVNVATRAALYAGFGRLVRDFTGSDLTDKNEKLLKLVNAIAACRPFYSRCDFEDFLAAQLRDELYQRVQDMSGNRVVDDSVKRRWFDDGGLTGDVKPSGLDITPVISPDVIQGGRLDRFRQATAAIGLTVNLSETDFNSLLNAVGPGGYSYFATTASMSWSGDIADHRYSLNELDLASTLFSPGDTPDFYDLTDTGWSWTMNSHTGGFAFNLSWTPAIPSRPTPILLNPANGHTVFAAYKTQDLVPAMELKFRSRFYHCIIVGQSLQYHSGSDFDPLNYDEATLEVIGEQRIEIVYDAHLKRIAYRRRLSSEKAALWDPVP